MYYEMYYEMYYVRQIPCAISCGKGMASRQLWSRNTFPMIKFVLTSWHTYLCAFGYRDGDVTKNGNGLRSAAIESDFSTILVTVFHSGVIILACKLIKSYISI